LISQAMRSFCRPMHAGWRRSAAMGGFVHHCTLGGLYKGLDLFPNSMPGSPASFSAAFLDDGLAICCGRPQRDAMILCAVIRETQLDRDGFRLAVSQKSMGGSSLPAPPIVAKRARTAAKLWVFGWPRFSQRNWRTSNPTSVCQQVTQDLSKPPPLQLQLELELAAHSFCS
jgi:hypothetical protein